MADEEFRDEADMTKRERQKARRAQRLEAERAAASKAQRKRLAGFVVVGLLVAGGIGYFVQQNLAERRAEQEMVEAALANLDQLGCTPDEEMPTQGAGHFENDAEIASTPPDAVYQHLPTTSGRHIGSVVTTGVYDSYVDERLTTHNLEHGYVVMWYDEDADPDQIAELKQFAEQRIEEGDQEIIVAPYNQDMDEGANFAFVAWERRQLCEQFDPGVALHFINEHMNDQRAPEAFAGPHRGGQPGELDPAEDQVVFPPLADGAPTQDGDGEGGTEDVEMDSS